MAAGLHGYGSIAKGLPISRNTATLNVSKTGALWLLKRSNEFCTTNPAFHIAKQSVLSKSQGLWRGVDSPYPDNDAGK
jgi:hypothetical protein